MKLYIAFNAHAKGCPERTGRIILEGTTMPRTAEKMKEIEIECERRVRNLTWHTFEGLECVIIFMHELED